MVGESKGLKPIQMQAIHLLLEKGERAGAVRETAEEIGLRRVETIARCRHQPEFVLEYQRQKGHYEAALAEEPLASKRRRIQLLTAEIDALQTKREEEGASLGEAAAASRAIRGLVKQIADEMGPMEKKDGDVGTHFEQNNLNIILGGMSTQELVALREVLHEGGPAAQILMPVLKGAIPIEEAGS